MPDPRSNTDDVEDVLSSIRKLVSDRSEIPDAPVEAPRNKAESQGEDDPGALVLSPSLLVNIPPQKAANAADPVEETTSQAGFRKERPERVVSRLHLFEIAEQEDRGQSNEYYEDEMPLPLSASLAPAVEPEAVSEVKEPVPAAEPETVYEVEEIEHEAAEEEPLPDDRWPVGDESSEFERPDATIFEEDDPEEEVHSPDIDVPEIDKIDDEVLRKLVAEAVRNELMGETGTRLSQNLRKMVRREVRRALQTQEFD